MLILENEPHCIEKLRVLFISSEGRNKEQKIQIMCVDHERLV